MANRRYSGRTGCPYQKRIRSYCIWTGYETGIPASAERYQDPYLYSNGESKTYKGKFGPDVFRDFIIDFILENEEEPLFIYYPMVLTHTPLVGTADESADENLGKHTAMVRYADKIIGEIMVLERETVDRKRCREPILF